MCVVARQKAWQHTSLTHTAIASEIEVSILTLVTCQAGDAWFTLTLSAMTVTGRRHAADVIAATC